MTKPVEFFEFDGTLTDVGNGSPARPEEVVVAVTQSVILKCTSGAPLTPKFQNRKEIVHK